MPMQRYSRRRLVRMASALLLACLASMSWSLAAAEDDGSQQYQGDDYIKYWTDHAILPKRCIVYNNVDMIVFAVFSNGYRQCSNNAIGTYVTPVPTFVDGYMEQLQTNAESEGDGSYELPDAAQYTQCTYASINGVDYYVQLGCSDGTSQAIAVNIYEDNTCETRSAVDGYDDANIDVSSIQLPFKQCKPCVNWIDATDDQVDDQWYENIQTNAPLCSAAWQYKETCNRKCQKTGISDSGDGWNTSDKILLSLLGLFGTGMLAAILQKRQSMSNKDALLEQAAMSAAGLQQVHVIGIFILVILVITVFALLGLKNITWALLLIMNTLLFGYLMKLTVDSGVSTGETVIGPDGTIVRKDSDDTSIATSQGGGIVGNAGTYRLPTLA